VDSVIITLTSAKKGQSLSPKQEEAMFAMIEASFSQKRKSLKNTLRRILGEQTENKLNEAGIDPAQRPEEISLNAWMTLAERM
jgi:16S rRNA (adenine1518-N6/adenine1519-N6)-dimethyltransferase